MIFRIFLNRFTNREKKNKYNHLMKSSQFKKHAECLVSPRLLMLPGEGQTTGQNLLHFLLRASYSQLATNENNRLLYDLGWLI